MKKSLNRLVISLFGFLAFPGIICAADDMVNTTSEGTKEGLAGLVTTAKESVPKIIIAIIVMVVSIFFAKIAQRAAKKSLLKTSRHEAALAFVGKTAFSLCITLGITIALSVLGIDVGIIVGAATFGLGFALKDVIQNYISGILILLQEPFKIGDIISIDQYFGRVEEIEARSTYIRIWDGQRIVIPNSFILASPLTNYSTYPERRINIAVGVSYDTDLEKVIPAILSEFSSNAEVLKTPAPLITFKSFGASSIDLIARFWIDGTASNWLKMTSEGVKMVKRAMDKAGINIPYPVTTLSLNTQDSDDMYRFFDKK